MGKIQQVHISDNNGNVNKYYEGYISAFGANITQSGLIPTLIFYQNDTGKEKPSHLWLDAIRYVISDGAQQANLIDYVISNGMNSGATSPFSLSDFNQMKLQAMEDKILDVVLVLKMAVRTYKILKEES